MKTTLVLDALEQALWTRQRDGGCDLAGLIHHTDAGSRSGYTSVAFTERLAVAGVSSSAGTVGDSLLQRPGQVGDRAVQDRADQARRPWRTAEQVELATLECVDWYGHRRLYEACGDIPPAELEAAY